MSDKTCVILGTSTSLFVRQLASYWRSQGQNPFVVTYDYPVEPKLADGTPIISCVPLSPFASNRILLALLHRIERFVVKLFRVYLEKITGKKPESYLSVVRPLVHAYHMTRITNSLHPQFVFGQEVMSYGLATAFCKNTKKVLFPWGGDVYSFSESSIIAYWIAKYSLRRADLIVPASTTAKEHIAQRFKVDPMKIKTVTWGVDRNLFRQANAEERKQILLKYGIPADSIVFLNVRRFMPLWGCFTVLEVFIRLARENPRYHFMMLGGPDTELYMREAKGRIESEKLQGQFTLIAGEIPLGEVAELMSISDIAFSLMKHSDMRSWSVLQAIASGAVPIVSSNNTEFREMEKKGFTALFVDPEDVTGAVKMARIYTENESLRLVTKEKNFEYIAKFEDYDKQMETLLSLCMSN
jgi:glycosyltransferase involved in cell wall biosynthesis